MDPWGKRCAPVMLLLEVRKLEEEIGFIDEWIVRSNDFWFVASKSSLSLKVKITVGRQDSLVGTVDLPTKRRNATLVVLEHVGIDQVVWF